MSVNYQVKVKAFNDEVVNIEHFETASELVSTCEHRSITSSLFYDMSKKKLDPHWHSVKDYAEALALMKTGYQPTVEKLGKSFKISASGVSKRISFFNDVAGFSPIVPLALLGVPNSMTNSYMKPIKAKVLDVYYDMTAGYGTSVKVLTKAGQALLGAIMELEMQGYKFNLYAVQSYYERRNGCDLVCIKIKSSNTPVDLKRMSFPLTHPAFFRVIGFDWYSKTPKGKHRSGYGHALGYEFNNGLLQAGFSEMFGNNCTVFSAAKILKESKEHLKEVLTNKEVKANG